MIRLKRRVGKACGPGNHFFKCDFLGWPRVQGKKFFKNKDARLFNSICLTVFKDQGGLTLFSRPDQAAARDFNSEVDAESTPFGNEVAAARGGSTKDDASWPEGIESASTSEMPPFTAADRTVQPSPSVPKGSGPLITTSHLFCCTWLSVHLVVFVVGWE